MIADGLGDGFARAARAADLPDVIVRFDPQSLARGSRAGSGRFRTSPRSRLAQEFTNVDIGANGHSSGQGSAEVVGAGRRGYAIVAGRDLSSRYGEVVVERGLAQAWGIPLGGTLYVRGLGPQRVVGFAEAPDNVGFPLAVPRFYLSEAALDARFGPDPNPQVNVAEIWLRDPRYLNEVLVQARTTSYGLRGLRFITRSGVRVLLDQAAGIVIDLLVALSLFALATGRRDARRVGARRGAATAEDDRDQPRGRRLPRPRGQGAGGRGGRRSRSRPRRSGVLAGVLATVGPSDRLLTMLNEPPAGSGLIVPLAAGWMLSVSIPVLAAAWPAWRAAGRPPVALLQGAGLRGRAWIRRRRALGAARAGLAALGARLVAARRGRLAATVLTLGTSAAFVLLLLALASALSVLETDPGALGKRYQLTSSVPAAEAGVARSVPGVQAAAARYEEQAARLVLAWGDDRRDRLSGRSHDLRGASADRRAPAEGHRRGGGRRRPRRRARAEPRIDARDRAPVRRRAAAARRRRRQLARPRRTRRIHSCGRVVARRSVGARGDRDPPAAGRRSDAVDRRADGARAAADSGERRDRPRGAARRHAADDPASGRDRRRARLPVRADPDVRADTPGAATHRRRVARDRSRIRGRSAGCWPASCSRS